MDQDKYVEIMVEKIQRMSVAAGEDVGIGKEYEWVVVMKHGDETVTKLDASDMFFAFFTLMKFIVDEYGAEVLDKVWNALNDIGVQMDRHYKPKMSDAIAKLMSELSNNE